MFNIVVKSKKSAVISFAIFFIGTIMFSLILLTVSLRSALLTLIGGTVISFSFALLNYVMNTIYAQESQLIIKADLKSGKRKEVIKYEEMKKVERHILKAPFDTTVDSFVIHLTQDNEDFVYEIGKDIYFTSDLTMLFESIELHYKVPFETILTS